MKKIYCLVCRLDIQEGEAGSCNGWIHAICMNGDLVAGIAKRRQMVLDARQLLLDSRAGGQR